MALHPSGSAREDVELVSIETETFSLAIKGKPFHPRYEGLKQYRALDFHDVMQFQVAGEEIIRVRVFDVEHQKLVEPSIQRPIFFENMVYQVIVQPKKDIELSFYHEHPLLRNAVDRVELSGTSYVLMGALQFQNEVGLTTFEIRSNEQSFLQVTLEIFPTKLDYKRDYQKLLEEVNDEIYNLAYHFIKKTYLGAKIKLDGEPSASEFYRLISAHFQSFLQAIDRIERQPHHKLEKVHVRARGDQLQRLDAKGRSDLRKKAHLFVEVSNGIRIQEKTMMPTHGLKMKKELTYDTLENRYVKWMLSRLIHKLDSLLEKLTMKTRYETEPDEDLIEKIIKMKRNLQLKTKNHFWKSIGKLDRSVMSLVLQMAPGYRNAFQIYLTVSKGLALQGTMYQMSVKDIATLYEYWTYIKLGQLLSKKYVQVSQDIVKVNKDGLFVNLDSNQSAKRVFKHPVTNERIELMYQKTGGKLPTTAQKPDTMLSIQKKGKDYFFNYVFDAKYRIDFAVEGSYYGNRYQSPGPLEEDINTMHRYRDSLVVQNKGPYERNAYGAYVLFPWENEAIYQEHHFYESIDKVNIGGLPFLPNATELVERFVENLIEKSPEEILEEGILPRGTLEEWQSALEEKVLIITVSTETDYRQMIQEGEIPLTFEMKKGWQDIKYIALYGTKEVGFVHGVKHYARIDELQVWDNHLLVKVEAWESLPTTITPVNYGVSTYAMTTLQSLKEAQELPELFMKSREEMMLWRVLRRVSDRIKLDLNTNQLDTATKVQSYQVKDIQLEMNTERNEIQISKDSYEEIISMDDLHRKPSYVFKQIIKAIG
ncbi:restriction endonuclease-like protein [Alkalihalobacterium chitinilyticum]|uniref:Restriction endonuclease-like protein n=1 Tax=Alkalihalobacterium chitinilyticum TaxID=2980103 RepID=A0ABT5VHE4_9BACI|nr:restriction endonuclease-like protein [Alkalihalobacterium chitinilyticum]MDE5414177.1 restriction endonuclease-like protein [Alkalihalobacterium chitinilyticum]